LLLQSKLKQTSPLQKVEGKKIIDNKPNVESLSSQHSRKSSIVAKEINDSQRSETQKSIRQVLDNEQAED
jgi:hypothetical protein